MLYDGLFSRPAGLSYGSFDETRHKVPRIAIPPEGPRFLGLDFGGVNTAIFFAQARSYFIGERFMRIRMNLPWWALCL